MSYFPISRFINNSNYNVASKEYHHGSVNILITQANAITNYRLKDVLCAGWIFIKSNKGEIDSIVFPNIIDYGGNAGLFVPNKQFSDNLFAIEKLGDYSGMLILIDLNGKVLKFPGGAYFLAKDKNILFSISELDCTGIDIIDLNTLKSLYSTTCLPKSPDFWFQIGNKYYFTSIDYPDSAYFYEGPKRGFISKLLNNKLSEGSEKIELDFNP